MAAFGPALSLELNLLLKLLNALLRMLQVLLNLRDHEFVVPSCTCAALNDTRLALPSLQLFEHLLSSQLRLFQVLLVLTHHQLIVVSCPSAALCDTRLKSFPLMRRQFVLQLLRMLLRLLQMSLQFRDHKLVVMSGPYTARGHAANNTRVCLQLRTKLLDLLLRLLNGPLGTLGDELVVVARLLRLETAEQ